MGLIFKQELVGINSRSISLIERGSNFVTAETLTNIAKTLNVSMKKLFDFDQDILYIKLCLEIKKIRSLFVKKEKKKQDKSNIIKNTILMPTYKGHFKFVKKFLKSADKFLLDKDSTEIVFVINKNEDKVYTIYKIVRGYLE